MAYYVDLRDDIMAYVTKYLPLRDYIRFGAIHPSWSAMAKARCHPPSEHGFPLLILKNNENSRGDLMLFNVCHQKFYPFDLPYGYHCCGSSRGWLLMMDSNTNLCLLHPFSRTQIKLPSFLSNDEEEYQNYDELASQMEISMYELLQEKILYKVVLSADPEECSDYIVMALKPWFDLIFWRPGDSSWTSIILPDRFRDVIWYKGAFYAMTWFKEVLVIDPSPPNIKVTKIVGPWYGGCRFCEKYLVDCMGDLLFVGRKTEETNTMHVQTSNFFVFKWSEERMKFIKVESIGDHALFIGRNSSFAIPIGECTGCLKDSIYFTDYYPSSDHQHGFEDLGLYNMKDKIFEIFPPRGVFTPSKFQPIWLEAHLI